MGVIKNRFVLIYRMKVFKLTPIFFYFNLNYKLVNNRVLEVGVLSLLSIANLF
ncbi:hypothetical protein VCRA2133E348_720018 [Vibrio crassostreae]|nr:hypothetical protein VCRA2133E348_720018 [Vibrio crassostreae]CAK3634655.1 hypothetical protein VCRA213O314_760001 [Vibrio crassostreae]